MASDRPDSPPPSKDQSPQPAAGAGSEQEVGWFRGNVANPLINGLIEPVHEAAKLVEKGTGHKLVPDPGVLAVSKSEDFGSSLTRSIAGTIGSIVPYLVVGKLTGGMLRGAGGAIEQREALSFLRANGRTSEFLSNERTGMVLGAGIIGGAKEPENDTQSRLGNAVGNMVGFYTFEKAGALANGWTTNAILQRAGYGLLGGGAQSIVQSAITNHDLPSFKDASIGSITGGVISSMLPLAHAGYGALRAKPVESTVVAAAVDGPIRLPGGGEPPVRQMTHEFALAKPEQVPAVSERPPVADMTREAREQLAKSIKQLPESERLSTWIELANSGTRLEHPLTMAIRDLPKSDAGTAFKIALEKFPDYYYLSDAARELHPNDLPGVVDAMFKLPEGQNREKLLTQLSNWPWQLDTISVENKTRILSDVFKTGFEKADLGEQRPLHLWWANIPEPRDPHTYEQLGSPIRDALVAQFEPPQLAKAVFSWTNPEQVQRLAAEQPDLIRSIARRQFEQVDSTEIHRIEEVLKSWEEHKSFTDVFNHVLRSPHNLEDYRAGHVTSMLVDGLAKTASPTELSPMLRQLRENVLADGANEQTIARGRWLAQRISSGGHADVVQQEFVQPIERFLSDDNHDYRARVAKAGALAASERSFETADVRFAMPDLRMPKQDTGLSADELATVRARTEQVMADGNISQMHRLLGDGPLGRMLPGVLGSFETHGGIVGRPQHSGHQYPIHAHSLLAAKWLYGDPKFQALPSPVKETGMWAALLHDTGKRPNISDPNHEWLSGKLTWGVMQTLDYHPVRTQRVSSVIAHHSGLSYNPESLVGHYLQNHPEKLDAFAAHYANPFQLDLVRRFNEADIKAVYKDARLWKPGVEAELDRIHEMVGRRSEELTRHSIPVLTTALPSRFSLVPMNGPHALMGHVSDHLGGAFLNQLSLVESPHYSMSTSLFTHEHRQFYNGQNPEMVALVTGPYEQISQAYRRNLGTGRGVGWEKHVQLMRDWASPENLRARDFAEEIDARVRAAGVEPVDGYLGSLRNLRRMLAHYDSFDELVAQQGNNSPLVRGQREVFQALTTTERGAPLDGHNEMKMSNPTLIGLGIIRNGKPIVLENIDAASMRSLLGQQEQPSWLVTRQSFERYPVVIPEAIWRRAQRRDLPLVVLDP